MVKVAWSKSAVAGAAIIGWCLACGLPVHGEDLYIAVGQTANLQLSLTSLPPSTGLYANVVCLGSSPTNVSLANPSVELTGTGSVTVTMTGLSGSPNKNGTLISAKSYGGNNLGSASITVFGVEISQVPLGTMDCTGNYLQADGQVEVDLRPADLSVTGALTVAWGNTILTDVNMVPLNNALKKGGDSPVMALLPSNDIPYTSDFTATWQVPPNSGDIAWAAHSHGYGRTISINLGVASNGLVWLNEDYDDQDVIEDRFYTGSIGTEDDLVAMSMSFGPPEITTGTLILEAMTGGNNIRIWENQDRSGSPISLPKTWAVSDSPMPLTQPLTYYIEGTNVGSAELWLSWSNEASGVQCSESACLNVGSIETLTLADPAFGGSKEDTTRLDESQSTTNTLYVGETTNGDAQVQIWLDWLPENLDGNRFRWEIRQANRATTAQWIPTSGATFAANPGMATWTNQAAGQSNRTFKVTGWYDANSNGTFDASEPHRLLYATVVKAEIVDAGKYIVPASTNNAVRYRWLPVNVAPASIRMEVYDKNNALVRMITNLPTVYLGTNAWAEQKWNGETNDAGTFPLMDTNSPYTLKIIGTWSGTECQGSTNASVEPWRLDLGIMDTTNDTETLVTGVDEDTVVPSNLAVNIALDGNTNILTVFSVSNNVEATNGPAGNEWGCYVTPTNLLFYTTPITPYDIRYQVTTTEETSTNATATGNGLEVKTVNDGALNTWDMNSSSGNRQTNAVWQFGINSTGSPPAAVMRNLQETYQ